MIKLVKQWIKGVLRKNDWIFSGLFTFTGNMLKRLRVDWEPRAWSNRELAKWGPLIEGDVINVSGWLDNDKCGGKYSDYFPRKKSYAVSNFSGSRGHSAESGSNQIFLDLSKPVPSARARAYDCVFNHTTLEHVYDIRQAVANLCELSRDLVVVVVPFLQVVHFDDSSYLDYWRATPFALKNLFADHGFQVIYLSDNDNPVHNVYLFCVASRNPGRWEQPMREAGLASSAQLPGRCWHELRVPAKTVSAKIAPAE